MNGNQYSFWHKEHQVLVTPIIDTSRDPNVYSLIVWVYAPNRTVILEDNINYDVALCMGFDNRDEIVHYYSLWIDYHGDWSGLDSGGWV